MRGADESSTHAQDPRLWCAQWAGAARGVHGLTVAAAAAAALMGRSPVARPAACPPLKPPSDLAAAAAAALKGPPIINYRLNFGSLSGGSVTTAPITSFVNFIVKEVLVGMFLWPKRLTVGGRRVGQAGLAPEWSKALAPPHRRRRHANGPSLNACTPPPTHHRHHRHHHHDHDHRHHHFPCPQVPILSSNGFLPANDPAIDLEVERLAGRVRGVVRVEVIKAKGLKAYDTLTGGLRRRGCPRGEARCGWWLAEPRA